MPWIEINGITYKKHAFVVSDCFVLPHFVKIIDIIVSSENPDCYFVCEDYHTLQFNNHYHSYEVVKISPQEVFALKQDSLADHHALAGYQLLSTESLFICMKYHILEDL